MKRKDALETINRLLVGNEAVILSTGLISREMYALNDSPRNFYMTGSLGLASSIGLGIALCQSNRKVIIVEGDAALLMNLGTIPTIGHYSPKNLVHIVLDNQAYGSCSEEPSVSGTANLEKITEAAGYRHVEKVADIPSLSRVIESLLKVEGPSFILVQIELGGRRDLPRPLDLPAIQSRFRKYLGSR